MLKTLKEYQLAITELQQFLDAPKPPPVGSLEAQKFADLLDAIEIYEASLPPEKIGSDAL